MDEKTIVCSENYDLKRILTCFCLVGLLVFIIAFSILRLPDAMKYYNMYQEHHNDWDWVSEEWTSPFDAFFNGGNTDTAWASFGIGLVPCLFGLFWLLWFKNCHMVVTTKRVYGVIAGGKRVDLPLDSISALGAGFPKGVAVSSSSGRIVFALIKNRDEIHNAVGSLLVERQSKPAATTTIKQEIPQSNADELKKYKELLDSGVISQEEFDAKKKQLLGL